MKRIVIELRNFFHEYRELRKYAAKIMNENI